MGEYFKNIFSSREDVRVFNLDFKARLLKSGLDVLYEGEAFVQEEDIPDFKGMVKEWGVRKQLKIKKRVCNYGGGSGSSSGLAAHGFRELISMFIVYSKR